MDILPQPLKKKLKMVKISDIIKFLEDLVPLRIQENYDNCGLLIGQQNSDVKGVLIALDCTEEVIEEAISENFNFVITHHPIIFKGLKSLTGKNMNERAVIKAIKNEISVYAIHTNLDNIFYQGVNHKIAAKLGLMNQTILHPNIQETTKELKVGSGILGELETPMEMEDILSKIKNTFDTKVIRYTKEISRKIQKVAVCGGAGSFLLKKAIEKDSDLFLSSDFKYHEFFDADQKIVIADIGHYESEQFTGELIFEILSQKFDTFALRCSKVNTNPINYYF